jgi:hypothetical protein
MSRFLISILATACMLFAQYKAEPAGAPPSDLAGPILALMQKAGHRVVGPDGKPYCEVWFRAEAPKAPESSEVDLMWKTVPPGSILGAIKFPGEGKDRRDQLIKPGVYNLRFSMFPINGDHQGAAPNRDFLVLTAVEDDKSPEPVANFEELVKLSKKVSGRQHPTVLSMFLVAKDFKPGIHQEGEDWYLHAAIGDTKIGLILIGAAE